MSVSLLTRGYIVSCKKILQQVPLNPTESQKILERAVTVKSLELPLPPQLTEAYGIHQSDIIIRSAIQVALADLRANPWLLDYVFASLPTDQITWKEYGEKSIQAAKAWFLKTNIPVIITPNIDEATWPAITVTLADSVEVQPETTLADVHYIPVEDNDSAWPPLVEDYIPTSYNPATGILSYKESPSPDMRMAPGMFIVDAVGKEHKILDVIDNKTCRIEQGTVADFSTTTLKSGRPALRTSLESASYRETYRVGVHVPSEAVYLTWLHSIMMFCLLRYKEALLEARGFERSVLQSSDFRRDEQLDTELVFTRYINVTGYVRHYWPKTFAAPIDVVDTQIVVCEADTATKVGLDPDDQLWIGENDD